MSWVLVVQPEAEADLKEAHDWYEARRTGLGHEMLDEAGQAFARIIEAPLRPRPRHHGTRRVRLRRFPYVVLYLARNGQVFVLAVFHERRSPRTFRNRTRDFNPT